MLQTEFGVEVADEELEPTHFATIAAICAYVESRS
jgi:acyl carrier protein